MPQNAASDLSLYCLQKTYLPQYFGLLLYSTFQKEDKNPFDSDTARES